MMRIRSLISIAANATTTIFCPDFISNGIIKERKFKYGALPIFRQKECGNEAI